MRNIKVFSLILVIITVLFGCDDKFQTSHPNEGGIVLTMDWSGVTTAIPPVYRARIILPTGFIRDLDSLRGETNLLIVDPGKVDLYVYNNAENISISGNKAVIRSRNGSVLSNPGRFFSHYQQVFTEADRETTLTAKMTQQTGELKLALALKPAEMIDKIKTINVSLEGVATELDMQTNELSGDAAAGATLSKNGYYATTTLNLFGFNSSVNQRITVDIELQNGARTSVTSDLSSLLGNFNRSKNTLFTLSAELHVLDENSPVITIDKWQQNAEMRYLSVYPSAIDLNQSASRQSISIYTDQPSWTYNVTQSGNWLTATQSGDRLELAATPNTSDSPRAATIVITAGGLNETVTVTQNVIGPYVDKEVVMLQSATVGKGIHIVLMGDGYTASDMERGTGKYERDMRAAADYFFSIYPYTEYRNYFNVYMIAAISNQAGISNQSTGKKVDTKFKSVWEGGRSTGISCDENVVLEYLDAIHDLDDVYVDDLTVIMPINANIYAGTSIMYHDAGRADFGNGFTICMCPVGPYYAEVVTHEGAGHGFGKLIDEYIYYPDQTIPRTDQQDVQDMKKYGWCENVDFYGNIAQTTWKGFAGNAKYGMVSTFEGGYLYGKGIWRPEFNSCMNDNTAYFNAPSRWAIVRRIMRLAGFNYSFAQFLKDDKIPVYPTTTRSYVEKDFVPFARPIIKERP